VAAQEDETELVVDGDDRSPGCAPWW
jgi:hypothetical protein